MFKTFTKIFSMFIIGMLMSLTLTGCGNNGNGNIVADTLFVFKV